MKIIPAFGFVVTGCLLGACGKDETAPPATPAQQQQPPPQYGAQQQQYPAQQQQYPAQQQQYPAQQQPYPQQPGAAPAAPGAAAPAGQMATPGPMALPCQNDAACGFAKCNVQYQKCAFPCQNSQLDCGPGNGCNTTTGLCLPGVQ